MAQNNLFGSAASGIGTSGLASDPPKSGECAGVDPPAHCSSEKEESGPGPSTFGGGIGDTGSSFTDTSARADADADAESVFTTVDRTTTTVEGSSSPGITTTTDGGGGGGPNGPEAVGEGDSTAINAEGIPTLALAGAALVAAVILS